MGLTFTVGNARHVFIEPYGANLDQAFADHFGQQVKRLEDEEPWYSEELGWSGWEQLQIRATSALGKESIPNLLSMPAWKGVYLPVEIEPCSLTDIPGDDTPLEVGSLDGLVTELERFGKSAGLPTKDEELRELAAKYLDDDLIDEDMDIQTYVQLMLAGHYAAGRRYPLWIVK
jgi:hypothetical protein